MPPSELGVGPLLAGHGLDVLPVAGAARQPSARRHFARVAMRRPAAEGGGVEESPVRSGARLLTRDTPPSHALPRCTYWYRKCRCSACRVHYNCCTVRMTIHCAALARLFKLRLTLVRARFRQGFDTRSSNDPVPPVKVAAVTFGANPNPSNPSQCLHPTGHRPRAHATWHRRPPAVWRV